MSLEQYVHILKIHKSNHRFIYNSKHDKSGYVCQLSVSSANREKQKKREKINRELCLHFMLSNTSISHSHYSKTLNFCEFITILTIIVRLYMYIIHAFCKYVIVISCICLNKINILFLFLFLILKWHILCYYKRT